MRALSRHTWVALFIFLTRRPITVYLITVALTPLRLKWLWLHPISLRLILLWLFTILSADDHHCRCLEVWDLVRVVSLDQCDLPWAVEFERGWENRFVVGGFLRRYTRDIACEGDVDIVLRSEHDESQVDLSRLDV